MRSGRCGSLSSWALCCLFVWAGCSSAERSSTPAVPDDNWEDVCVDSDGDGFGFQCSAGDDCDDMDGTIHEGCVACTRASEGCACEADAVPVDCTLPKELTPSGTLLCKSGTRYCRDGMWSACEGIKSFAAPAPSRLLTRAALDSDAAPAICDACNPDCYRLEDDLSSTDASYGNNVVSGPTGGITIASYQVGDGGAAASAEGGLLDDTICTPGTAPDFDCDGIPDSFDPYPGAAPFSSEHNTIFMDLGPGDSQAESFVIRFYLNTADIYLYLDMTGSMGGERTNLIASLRDGNYMANAGVGVECADRNFNGSTADEEYLKNEGIAGNLACLIRDGRLGTGWHRDLPFPRADTVGFAFGPHDFELFQHEQDITDNVDDVLASLNRFVTRGGINRPEGGIMGLYALATGNELYMGWSRPGNPARQGCPVGTWGYPCFRDDAVPIIIWMTNAPATNGPSTTQGHLGYTSQGNQWNQAANQLLNWDAQSRAIEQGSDAVYHQLSNSNESVASAHDLGAVNDSFITYTGNTTGMTADVTYANIGGSCGSGTGWLSSAQGAPDAVFKFTVDTLEPITVSTRGTRFNGTIAIVDADRVNVPVLSTTLTSNSNTTPGTAYSMGELTYPGMTTITSNYNNAGALFSRDSIGCLDVAGATDKAGASLVKFNLAQDVAALRIIGDSTAYGVSTALFNSLPRASTDTNLGAITVTAGTVTLTGNSNDYFDDYNASSDLNGKYLRFVSGSTADTDLTANFAADYFQTGTCSGTAGTAKDAVFDFTLSAATRVRLEGTGGTTGTLAAGFDHVLQLVRKPVVAAPIVVPVSGNTSDATAHAISVAQIPTDPNAVLQYTGTMAADVATAGLRGDYFDNENFTGLALTRVDTTVNFDWGTDSPDSTIGADTFSVRWTGTVTPRYTQAYTFYTYSDDGVRLWVNDVLIVDNWTDHGPTENSGTTAVLTANQPYSIRMEFYEQGGGAVAGLSWSSTSQAKEVIPSTQLSTGAVVSYLQSEVGPLSAPLATDCKNAAAASTTSQAVFAMDVTSTQSYDFDTLGSASSSWLSIHQDVADTQRSLASTNSNNAGAVQRLGTIDEKSLFVTGGSVASHGSAATDYVNDTNFGCGAAANGGRDAIYSFSVNTAQTVNVSAVASAGTPLAPGLPGFNSRVAVFQGSISNTNRVGGDCSNPSGNGFNVTNLSVSPGITYYVVVKSITTGSLTGATAAYGLWIRDTTFNTHFLECDYASQPNSGGTFSIAKISRVLTPGRYYIVVKSSSNTAAYKLNVRRTQSLPTVVACDRNSAGTRHSIIDQTLPAGSYSVIVRGYAASTTGSYYLIMRDMNAVPEPLSCVYDAASTTTPMVYNNVPARDASGQLIDYYVVVRGVSSLTGNTIRFDGGETYEPARCAYDNVTMTEPSWVASYNSTDINSAEWSGTLPLGDYYIVLKGYDQTASTSKSGADWGMYQLSVGDRTNHESAGTFADQRWLGPTGNGVGGISESLLNRQIRVITVDSTSGSGDDATYSDQQLRTVAQATDAVALSGSPLFFKINSDGTGLGTTIVQAVNDLAGNLAMDVSVRLVELPDSPAPRHFRFLVRAVDTAGDLCQPPIDTDGDSANTPDTHVDCTPGAVPRFEVTFQNPNPPNQVLPNPNDPNGGYNMRLELIGDGQYVVDEIPVYIIPDDVVEEVGDTRFQPSASYEQVISATGCFGTESPLWRTLSWDAAIPNGTTLVWRVCTADTVAELAGCSLQTAATVQTGTDCAADSDCPNGYCNSGGMCEFALGPACSSDDECGVNGMCVDGACMWSDNPADVKPALLRSLQGKRHARVQVEMLANSTRTRAPTVNTWGLKYTCTAQE